MGCLRYWRACGIVDDQCESSKTDSAKNNVLICVFYQNDQTLLLAMFQCLPIHYFWDRAMPGAKGKCVKAAPALIAFSAFNVFSDVVILLLPIPIVWNLKVSRRQKVSLSGVFLLGVL